MPKNPDSEGSPVLLTIDQIAAKHRVSRSSVHTYRRGGTFPRPVPVEGTTRVLFDAAEVAAWFEANPKRQGSRTDIHSKKPQQGEPVSTTVDPRIALMSALNDPPYDDAAGKRGTPLGEAAQLLNAYRARELRLAAEAIEQEFLDGITDSDQDQTWNAAVKAIATALRQSASESEES